MSLSAGEPIHIAPYDARWPIAFEREREILLKAIGRWTIGPIEHIGSTAVPGLEATPIIDIMAGVKSLTTARAAVPVLRQLQYRYYPYQVELKHWFCKPSPSVRTHHLHLVPFRSRAWMEPLAFRDYLRKHGQAAQAYSMLKQQLALEHGTDREAYTNSKRDFVRKVIELAVRENPDLLSECVEHVDEPVRLVEPSEELKSECLAMLGELEEAMEDYGAAPAREDFGAYLQELRATSFGIGLPSGFVPMSTYWLVNSEGRILGESRLRHRLTPALEDYGGHIGYVIRPSERRKGFGTRILSHTLERALELGIRLVRVTCDTENVGSARIIERNGGLLSGYSVSPVNGRRTSQYWIEL